MPTVRPALKAALVFTVLLSLSIAYYAHVPFPGFSLRLKEFFWAAAITIAAGAVGTIVLERLIIHFSNAEAVLFSWALGLSIFSVLLFFLGCIGLLYPAVAMILVFGALSQSMPFLKRCRAVLPVFDADGSFWDEPFFATLILIGVALSFVFALAPITYYDSLVYHLSLPSAYIRAHRIIGLQDLVYSCFPQTLEMIWTLALLVCDDAVSNLIGWTLAMGTLLGVYLAGRRFLTSATAPAATAFLAIMPSFLLLSSGGYVDIGLALFSFLSLYSALLYREEGSIDTIVLAGFFSGITMGIKYTGLISALVVLGILILPRRGFPVFDWKNLGLRFAVPAVALELPWLIKNLYYVGNPIFPFAYRWSLTGVHFWAKEAAAGYFLGIVDYESRSVTELAGTIWDIALNSYRFGGGIDALGDLGWTLFIVLLPGLWLITNRKSAYALILAFVTLFFIPWACTRPVLRFLMPALPAIALLAGYAWVEGFRMLKPVYLIPSRCLLGGFLASGLFLFFVASSVFDPFPAALGIREPAKHLLRTVNYYGAAYFVNHNVAPDARLYIMGDQRRYYYEREASVSPVFSTNPLVSLAAQGATATGFEQFFKERGITHLVINRRELKRLQPYHTLEMTTAGKAQWENYLKQKTTILYHDENCEVYAL